VIDPDYTFDVKVKNVKVKNVKVKNAEVENCGRKF